jgi:hypothetical protein
MKTGLGWAMAFAVAGLLFAAVPVRVQAHCDTMEGPVIVDARAALEKGDVTPVLKWVREAQEPAIRDAFGKALAATGGPADARGAAEKEFFEALVRIHREGEGAPYTGLKTTPVEPIVALADGALESGSADDVIGKVTAHIAAGVRERFEHVVEARKHKDESIEAGREFVEAYVTYVHYVEGIHAAAMGGGHHEEE